MVTLQLRLRSRSFVAALSLLALPLLTALPAHAQFGTNLIVNGDAESGAATPSGTTVEPVPGWNTAAGFTAVQYADTGGFPSLTDPGPAVRGSNFFAGGPDNSFSEATQSVDVSALSAAFSSGLTPFTLSGYIGGFAGQDDNAVFRANFLDSNGVNLGSAQIGPVSAGDRENQTGLLFRSANGMVPAGTSSVFLDLQMTRLQGSYNDGYADNLSFTLDSPAAVPEASTTISFGLLLALGLGGVMVAAKKKKAVKAA